MFFENIAVFWSSASSSSSGVAGRVGVVSIAVAFAPSAVSGVESFIPPAILDNDEGPGRTGVSGSIFGRNDELMSPMPMKKSSVSEI